MKRKIIAILLGCFVAYLIAEGALRTLCRLRLVKNVCFNRDDKAMALDQIDDLEFLLDTVPFSLHPYQNWNGFILNSKGFRTPEYELVKPEQEVRVVAIGDSFTFDCGRLPYPQHFTVLLEKKLAEWLARPVEVINLGQPGVGPRFEQRLLEIEGIPHDPDLVVWLFFVGNDFTDENYDTRDTPWLPESYDWPAVTRHLYIKSYLLRALRNAYTMFPYLTATPSSAPEATEIVGTYVGNPQEYDPNEATFDRDTFLFMQSQRMSVYSEKTFPRSNWETIQEILKTVRDACQEASVPLLFVIIPDENQVNEALLAEVTARLGASPSDFQMDYPQRLLVDFLGRERIDYLDLLPAFREATNERVLYALQDTHWNHEGNRLASEQIFQHLRNMKYWFAPGEQVEMETQNSDR